MTPEAFLSIFFGPGNDIHYPELASGRWRGLAAVLEKWIDRLTDHEPTMLPRRIDGELHWYGLSHTAADDEQLRATVLAWVGPSYSDFIGRPPLGPRDPFEERIAEFTGGNWFSMRVGPGLVETVRESLDWMRRLDEQRPDVQRSARQPIGRLLRDFDWAVRRKDPETSLGLLRMIQASGHLSAMNVSYLNVQRLAALDLCEELLELPDLSDVIDSQRPSAVTSAILEALHRRFIDPFVDENDVDGALQTFEREIAGRYNKLFGGATPGASVEQLRLHLLWAALPPQKPNLRDEVLRLATGRGFADAPLLASIGVRIEVTGPAEAPWVVVEAAIRENAFNEALAHLQPIVDGRRKVELAIHIAIELDEGNAAAYAMELLADLPDNDQRRIAESRLLGPAVGRLRVLTASPSNWYELVSAIQDGVISADELDLLRNRWRNWDTGTLLENSEAVGRTLLADRSPYVDSLLRSVFPELVDVLTTEALAIDDPRVRSILIGIVYALRLADGRSPGDLETLLDLADHLLARVSEDEYTQLIEDLLGVWKEDESLRRLPWFVDLAEVVVGHPQRAPGAAGKVSGLLQDVIRRRHRQMTSTQVDVVVGLLSELGVPTDELIFERAPPARAEHAVQPEGRVGVYTLTPGVGQRVIRLLSQRAPDLDVRVNSDTRATEQLISLAREVDVFVVVTRSATHAATDAIKKARPEGKSLLYARGKGSTSVLEALEGHFDDVKLATV